MKDFLKMTLAVIVGFMVVNLIGIFFFVAILGTLTLMQNKTVIVEENSILKIELDRELLDRASDDPLNSFNYFTMKPKRTIGLTGILRSLEKAKTDDKIQGVYLDLTDVMGNFGALASVEEIRNALLDFKASGKFIYSYSNLGYSQKAYYLATAADQVNVNPETPLTLQGMSSAISFYKNTLMKLGIQPEIVKVGKFKSAVEPFVNEHMSDANREQMQRYLDSSWGTIVDAIASSRGLTVEKINEIANNFRFYSAEESKTLGFFDQVMYEDEMLEMLGKQVGEDDIEDINFVQIADYSRSILPVVHENKVAVVYAQGEIGMEQSDNSIGPKLVNTLRKLRFDDNVKAVVMRVNSPGGSALTSELIWREVELIKREKPVIVSMGNVAASGGYYISCGANKILADSMTLTGSIGVFGMFFSGEELIKDRMGINTDVVKTNEHSDFGGAYPLPLPISSRPMTDYERNVLQQYVNRTYDVFLQRVADGRGMTRAQVDSIGQGRVWTGQDALRIGLVDELGGMTRAIQLAAQMAEVSHYEVLECPKMKNMFEELITEFSSEIESHFMERELGGLYSSWKQIKQVVANEGVLARIPFDMTL